MAERYSFAAHLGGSVTQDALTTFLETVPLNSLTTYAEQVEGCGEASYSEIDEIMQAAEIAGLSIRIEADGRHEIGPAVYVHHDGEPGFHETASMGEGKLAISLENLKAMAKKKMTIEMAIESMAPFDRNIGPLLVDGVPVTDAMLKLAA